MKECKDCGTEIDDKYEFCFKCSKELKKDEGGEQIKVLKEIAISLRHINWNMGSLVMLLKGDKDTLKKIEKDIKKDLNTN